MKNSVMGLTPRFCVVNDTEQDIDVRCRNVKVMVRSVRRRIFRVRGFRQGRVRL